MSLNAGEVSPLMACRLDVERRAAGMEEVKNLLVLEHGGVAKRPGMEMVKAVETADEGSRLIPHEAKMTDPAVLWMFDRRLYTVRHGAAVPDAFTATAFSGAAARDLQFTQVNDIVFCAHPEVHPFRLELAPGAAQVALKELTLTQQPWETLVQQEATVQYVPAGTGVDDAVTLKADRDLFTAAMAGKEWIRLTIHCNEYTARLKAEPDAIGEKNDVGTAVYHEPGARMYQEVADGNVVGGVWRYLYECMRTYGGPTKDGRQMSDCYLQGQIAMYPRYVDGDWEIRTTGLWGASYVLMRSYDTRADDADWRRWDWHAVKSFEQLTDMSQISRNTSSSTTTGEGASSTTQSSGMAVARPNYQFSGTESKPCHLMLVITRIVPADVATGSKDGKVMVTIKACDRPYTLQVQAVQNARQATAKLGKQYLQGISPGYTRYWSFGAFGPKNGFPSAIAFHENRLYFAGTRGKPQTVYGSTVDDYANFWMSSLDDSALALTILSRNRNAVQWMLSANGLLVGTGSNEWLLQGGGNGGAVTPQSFSISLQSSVGSADVQPVQAPNSALFVARGGGDVFETAFTYESASYHAASLSVLAEHLLRDAGGAVEMAYQMLPWPMIWVVARDGRLFCCSYNKDQGVVAWSRHEVDAGEPVLFRSVCVTHDPTDGEASGYDMVYLSAWLPESGRAALLRMRWKPEARLAADVLDGVQHAVRARMVSLPVDVYGGALQHTMSDVKRACNMGVRLHAGSSLQVGIAGEGMRAVEFKDGGRWGFVMTPCGFKRDLRFVVEHDGLEEMSLLAVTLDWNIRK